MTISAHLCCVFTRKLLLTVADIVDTARDGDAHELQLKRPWLSVHSTCTARLSAEHLVQSATQMPVRREMALFAAQRAHARLEVERFSSDADEGDAGDEEARLVLRDAVRLQNVSTQVRTASGILANLLA